MGHLFDRIFGLGALVSVGVIALSITACDPASFESVRGQNKNKVDGKAGAGIGELQNADLNQRCEDSQRMSEKFQINAFNGDLNSKKGLITNKVDVLIVTDTSSSMNSERNAIALNINRFFKGLPKGMDVNVGVMLAHGDQSPWSGKLYAPKGQSSVIRWTSKKNTSSLSTKLLTRLNGFRFGKGSASYGAGGEMGLYSLAKMVHDYEKYSKAYLQGMLREDAGLIVLFVSDEAAICTKFLGGYFLNDPDGDEKPTQERYCGIYNPKSVYKILRNLKPAKAKDYLPLVVGGVVYINDKTIPRDKADRYRVDNEMGYGYLDLIQLNRGQAIDMAIHDLGNGLEKLGKTLARKLYQQTNFQLQSIPMFSSLKVKSNGTPVNFDYTAVTSELHMPHLGSQKQSVEVSYCPLVKR